MLKGDQYRELTIHFFYVIKAKGGVLSHQAKGSVEDIYFCLNELKDKYQNQYKVICEILDEKTISLIYDLGKSLQKTESKRIEKLKYLYEYYELLKDSLLFNSANKKEHLLVKKHIAGEIRYYYISREKFEKIQTMRTTQDQKIRVYELDTSDLILNENYVLTNANVLMDKFIVDLKKYIKKGYTIDSLIEKINGHFLWRTTVTIKYGPAKGYENVKVKKIRNENDFDEDIQIHDSFLAAKAYANKQRKKDEKFNMIITVLFLLFCLLFILFG